MAKTLRVDHFPKNGKTSPNPKLANITAKASPMSDAGKDIKTQFNKKPALATANKSGQGMAQPKFGLGTGKGTYALGQGVPADKPANKVAPSNRMPGGESHPKSHAAFHALGAPKGGKY